MKLKVFYSVQNGGDGSAYPRFMESAALAEFDQRHMDEGWGESCTGSLSFESDSPIKCLSEIVTKEGYFIDRYCDQYGDERSDERDEFIAEFFPSGLPIFRVEVENPSKGYAYNNVFVEDRKVARVFRSTAKSGAKFESYLNSPL